MAKNEMNLIFLYVFILLLSSSTCILGNELHSCLTSNGVQNFTKFSWSPSSDYHKFLYLPMQNLIFSNPTLPKPLTVILPESKEQLVNTVLCCRKWSWTIRIRSGGHSFEGLSHIAETPFVIIDLMNLNRITVDLDSNTAWVESGATLGEMYYAISEVSNSLAFPGGWCPTVGSGGQLSGGGFGLMMRKYGLAADNIVDALLVSSKGVVLDREAMGEDVFWAIRGGGGGVWGAVYAWKIQLVPVPTTVTAIQLHRNGDNLKLSKLLDKWQFVAPLLEDDFSLSVMISTKENKPLLKFFGLYLGPKSEAISSANEAFPELEFSAEECTEMSWIDSVVYLADMDSIAKFKDRFSSFDKSHFKAKIDCIRKPIPLEGIDVVFNMLAKEPHAFVVLNGLGGMMSRIPRDAIPFPHRNGNLLTMDYIVAWNDEEDSRRDEFISWLQKFYNYMEPYVSKNPRVGYVNYVDLDFGQMDWSKINMAGFNVVEMARTWGEKYFLSNYDRLVCAKTIIDPENMFFHPQSIPPLPLTSLEEGGWMECNKELVFGSVCSE